MTLHTLNASPASAAFADCLRIIAAADALLLLGDGVYAALAGTAARAQLDACGARLYLLREDAAAAGALERVDGIEVIDIDGFVALSEQCPRQLAWY
jgi:tRNA 2-thiouridine synthesizing protein B